MNWAQLEQDINNNTTLLMKQKSRIRRPQGLSDRSMISYHASDSNANMLDVSIAESVGDRVQSASSLVATPPTSTIGNNSISGVGSDVETDYLKLIVNKQQQQINNLEKSLFALMADQKNKENNPFITEQQAIQQSLLTRLLTVEESNREINEKYASKEALLQLLNSVMEQIRECNRCIDQCSNQSNSVSQFSDAFLQALVEVSNQGKINLEGANDLNRSFNSTISTSNNNRKRTALSLSLLLGLGS